MNSKKSKKEPLVPNLEVLHQHLWRQFLDKPGVMEKLTDFLTIVKEDKTNPSVVECPVSDDDFLPLSESSRISLTENSVADRHLLPPSPRSSLSPKVHELKSPETFYTSKNIDLVPDRNIKSPVSEDGSISSVQVPVIKFMPAPPIECKPPLGRIDFVLEEEEQNESKCSLTLEERSQCDKIQTELINIPLFYPPSNQTPLLSSEFIKSIQSIFSSRQSLQLELSSASLLANALQLSPHLGSSIFISVFGASSKSGTCAQFLSFWQANAKQLYETSASRKTFHLLAGCTRNYLIPEDFYPVVQSVLETHHQLEFFRETSYFNLHPHYVTSVVAAIFYACGSWRRQRMYYFQFERLNFIDILSRLQDDSSDINFVDFFSYDQFYVFYTKFVHLDGDEDGELDMLDLLEYEDGCALTKKVVERIWEVNINSRKNMDYWHWVIFIMSEIDKTTESAVDYWFAVLDTDYDGFLTLGEMKEFYEEAQLNLITADFNVPQVVKWEDIETQICDIVSSHFAGFVSLMDLKKNTKFAHILDAFINIVNFITNDENDTCIQSELTELQKYIFRYVNENELS